MPQGPLYVVTANRLNLRSEPSLDRPPLSVLNRGATVELINGGAAEDWWRVRVTPGAVEGYVARRYLSPQSGASGIVLPGINEVLWRATQDAIAAGVRYKLGARSSATGVIDCSGWVAEITRKAFGAVNSAAAPETVFDRSDTHLLDTHSDGIIVGIESQTGFVLHGAAITADKLREGMLIGCNFGEYGWEVSDPPRVYGIDHIVQVVRDPQSNALAITQSSSSGNGVNVLPLASWLAARAPMQARLHAVDPFLLADQNSAYIAALHASLPAPVAPAPAVPSTLSGPVGSAPSANIRPAFKGRGAYVYSCADVLQRYGSVEAAVQEMRRCKLNHLWVRIHGRGYVGDAKDGSPALVSALIAAAKSAGIAVAGWGWCQGENITAEIGLTTQALAQFQLQDYVADIEQGVSGANWTAAEVTSFLSGVRPNVQGLCVTSHGLIDLHDPNIFNAAGADCFNPQVYWYENAPSQKMLTAVNATAGYQLADPASYAKLCFDRYTALYNKPVIVTAQAYADGDFTDADAEAKLQAFLRSFSAPTSLLGVNYWHWGAMTKPMRDAIAATA